VATTALISSRRRPSVASRFNSTDVFVGRVAGEGTGAAEDAGVHVAEPPRRAGPPPDALRLGVDERRAAVAPAAEERLTDRFRNPTKEAPVAHAIEIARFTAKPGAEPEMLAERPALVAAMRRRFPSYRHAYLAKLDDGTWMDVVVWADRAEAEAAGEEAYDYPEIAEWFRHIDEVTSFEYADVQRIDVLGGGPGSSGDG
jgi:hypothetical protein